MYKIAGLILAAGYSSRMGSLKALLPFKNQILIKKQIQCFKEAGISDVYVVLGHRSDEIKAALKNEEAVQFIINEGYAEGMLSSVQAGVKGICNKRYDAFFLMPVDYPLVQPYTLEILINEFHTGVKTVYPIHKSRKGHPPLISCSLCHAIIHYKGEGGLKNILKQYDQEAVYVEIGNNTVLIDIDTKQDYTNALKHFESRKIPSSEECDFIINYHHVPQRVIEHCKRVGQVARVISDALKEHYIQINSDLVYVSGLLHDFKKGTADHAGEGAKILYKMGFKDLSVIVGNHMNIEKSYLESLSEVSVLYYADKIVQETCIVSLEDRTREKKKINAFAAKRMADAGVIEKNIEKVLQKPVKDLIKEKVTGEL